MKQRLINANKLRKDFLDLPNCYNGFSDSYDKSIIIDTVDMQPTVKAIPIEWIRKWAGRNVAETDNCSWNTYTLKLLQDWEKENEAD